MAQFEKSTKSQEIKPPVYPIKAYCFKSWIPHAAAKSSCQSARQVGRTNFLAVIHFSSCRREGDATQVFNQQRNTLMSEVKGNQRHMFRDDTLG